MRGNGNLRRLGRYLPSGVRRMLKAGLAPRPAAEEQRPDFSQRLQRGDSRTVPEGHDELRLFIVARNAALRLPYLFAHYRREGVDRFFVVDNGSTDATPEFLASQPDAHVFRTEDSYSKAGSGMLWLEYLMDLYGRDRWCVVVDEDEILSYPHAEDLSLKDFCNYLDAEGATAVHSFLLDMYSDKPVAETFYRPGEPFLDTCPFFETGNRERRSDGLDEGGMRLRVFGTRNILSKHNLIKRVPGLRVLGGTHFVSGARLSSVRGATLHFKYFHDFAERVAVEAVRGEYWMNAKQYRAYASGMSDHPDVVLHHSGSVRWSDTGQLVALGLMHSNESFEDFAAGWRRRGGKPRPALQVAP
jgi:glycosyltransferase involved in cell wall biosynthesis